MTDTTTVTNEHGRWKIEPFIGQSGAERFTLQHMPTDEEAPGYGMWEDVKTFDTRDEALSFVENPEPWWDQTAGPEDGTPIGAIGYSPTPDHVMVFDEARSRVQIIDVTDPNQDGWPNVPKTHHVAVIVPDAEQHETEDGVIFKALVDLTLAYIGMTGLHPGGAIMGLIENVALDLDIDMKEMAWPSRSTIVEDDTVSVPRDLLISLLDQEDVDSELAQSIGALLEKVYPGQDGTEPPIGETTGRGHVLPGPEQGDDPTPTPTPADPAP